MVAPGVQPLHFLLVLSSSFFLSRLSFILCFARKSSVIAMDEATITDLDNAIQITVYDVETKESYKSIQPPELQGQDEGVFIEARPGRTFGVEVRLLEDFDFRMQKAVEVWYEFDGDENWELDGQKWDHSETHYIQTNDGSCLEDDLDTYAEKIDDTWKPYGFMFTQPEIGRHYL